MRRRMQCPLFVLAMALLLSRALVAAMPYIHTCSPLAR